MIKRLMCFIFGHKKYMTKYLQSNENAFTITNCSIDTPLQKREASECVLSQINICDLTNSTIKERVITYNCARCGVVFSETTKL